MDPQQQFRERYDKYVASQQELRGKAGTPAPAPGSKISKKVIIFLGVLALAFGGGALYALNVNNSGPQVATDNSTKTVTTSQVTDAEIDAELQKIWGQYYNDAKNNPKLREVAKQNILIIRAAVQLGMSNSSVASDENTNTQNALLQTAQDIENKVVTSRTIDYVNVYVPPTEKNFEKEKTKTKNNLEFVRTKLIASRSVSQAYKELVLKLGTDPRYYVQRNVRVTKTSGWAPQSITALFKLQQGDISSVIETEGGSILVAKVVQAVNTPYATLSDWEKANLK